VFLVVIAAVIAISANQLWILALAVLVIAAIRRTAAGRELSARIGRSFAERGRRRAIVAVFVLLAIGGVMLASDESNLGGAFMVALVVLGPIALGIALIQGLERRRRRRAAESDVPMSDPRRPDGAVSSFVLGAFAVFAGVVGVFAALAAIPPGRGNNANGSAAVAVVAGCSAAALERLRRRQRAHARSRHHSRHA